jgi:hypothetical protein
MKKIIASMLAVAGVASVASAQTYEGYTGPAAARLTFQVWNGSSWGSSAVVDQTSSNRQVEVRAVLSYTGTRTDLLGLGELLYQPTLSNADNEGVNTDSFGAWRNGGISGNAVANSMLSEAEGNNGATLASYGRVRFGGIATDPSTSNVITTFRHTAGSNGAPAGSWLRAAGSFVGQWPIAYTGTGIADDTNRILRGTSAQQASQAVAGTNWVAGTTGLVLWRQAVVISNDGGVRDLTLSSFIESARRVGGPTSTDNRRWAGWQTSASDSGTGNTGHRTLLEYSGATISVIIPSPASVALLGLGGLVATRRRRA